MRVNVINEDGSRARVFGIVVVLAAFVVGWLTSGWVAEHRPAPMAGISTK